MSSATAHRSEEAAELLDLSTHARKWMKGYKRLKEYKMVHGNCKVPQRFKEDPALGRWCQKQREYYKNYHQGKYTTMTPERMALLNAIDFYWTVEGGKKRKVIKDFRIHFLELEDYKNQNGNCRVPHLYDPNRGLGVFVHRVKIYHREIKEGKRNPNNKFLTKVRIQALNTLGLEWTPPRTTATPTRTIAAGLLTNCVPKNLHLPSPAPQLQPF